MFGHIAVLFGHTVVLFGHAVVLLGHVTVLSGHTCHFGRTYCACQFGVNNICANLTSYLHSCTCPGHGLYGLIC